MVRTTIDLLDYFASTKLRGRRVPLLASFKVTYRCNLRCRPCPFHERAGAASSHMDWETAVRSLDLLRARGTRIVIFEGGEPLAWSDGEHTFADLVAYAKGRFLRVGATSNGTLGLDAPTDVLWFSIDGTKTTHDALRTGSFDAMWENVLASTHPKLLAHFTANRENWCELPDVLDLLRRAPAVRGLTVQFHYPYSGAADPLALAGDERARAVDLALRMKAEGRPVLNSARRLAAMKDGAWRCHDWMLANVDPDGTVTTGCYVKGRGTVRCEDCGFTPVAEASGAHDLAPSSILAGWRTLLSR